MKGVTRTLVQSAVVVVASLISACSAVGIDKATFIPADSATHNVVIILTDDMGYGDIGAYGNTIIETPNIDELARKGLRFTNGYASANVCTPSRAGLLTGRYAIRSGLAWKVVSATDSKGLPSSEETLGELARRAGLRTAYVGKWHLGNRPEHLPIHHGFDRFFGVPHSNDMPGFVLYDDTKVIEESIDQSQLTRRYTDEAVRYIETVGAENPFLLVVSHTFPHIPLYASKKFHGTSAAGLYGDTIEELDWSTGEIVEALRTAGVADNTIVIFTSDNGPFFEGSAGSLRGGKGNSWEGGFRVPLIVSWPATIKPGRVTDAITMNIDILPTIADVLGLEPSADEIDGESLLDLFAGADESPHDFLYYFNNERVIGVRSRDWKFVTHGYYTGSLGAFEKFDQLPGFSQAYDLLFGTGQMDSEDYSVADRHPDVVEAHRDELERARRYFAPMRTRELESTYPD